MNQPSSSILSRQTQLGLELLFLVTLAVAATPFLFSNGSLDGDGLTYLMVYHDLFRDGFSFSHWVPGPGRGIELVLGIDFAVFYLTGEDLILTSYISAFLKSLSIYVTTRLVLNKVFRPSPLQRMTFALVLTVLLVWSFYLLAATQVVYVTSDTLKLLWYVSLGNLLIVLLFHTAETTKLRPNVWLLLVAMLGIIANAKFSAFVIVPCLAMWSIVTLLGWLLQHPQRRSMTFSWLTLMGSFLVGYFIILKRLMPNYHILQSYFPQELMKLSYSGRRFLLMIEDALLSDSLLAAFVLAQFALFAFLLVRAFLILKGLWQERNLSNRLLYRGFFVGLAISTCVVVIGSSLLLTKGDVSRYYMSLPFVLWLATMVETFHVVEQKQVTITKKPFLFGSIGLTVLLNAGFFFILPDLKEAKVSLSEMRSFSPKAGPLQSLTHCLLHNKKKHNLKDGLAEFWTARPIQMISSNKIRVVQIHPTTLNFYHFTNNAGYFWLGGKKLGKPDYNFLILGFQPVHDEFEIFMRTLPNPKMKTLIENRIKQLQWRGYSKVLARKLAMGNSQNIEPKNVLKVFGKPSSTFYCRLTNGDIRRVWVYKPSTGFDTQVKRRFIEQYQRWRKEKHYPYKLPTTQP